MTLSLPDTRSLYSSEAGHQRAEAVYEELLGLITVPYETTLVNTPLGVTHVVCAGPADGPPVILLHGQGASAVTWWGQINILAQRYRVIVPDVPASMGRSSVTRIPRQGRTAGEWLNAIFENLNLPKAHLVGISNGSWLILKFATVAPEKIVSASLLSAGGIVITSPRLILRALPLLLVARWLSADFKANYFAKMMGVPGKPPVHEDMIMFRVLLGDFHMEPTPSPLPDAELHCLTAPTYILVGEHEAAFPAKGLIPKARAILPNLQRVDIMSGVGHGMITEDVEGVSQRVMDFIETTEAAHKKSFAGKNLHA